MRATSEGRRRLLCVLSCLSVFPAAAWPAAQGRTFRVGYQKASGLLGLLKAQGALTSRLSSSGWDVSWAEFPAGPQLLEAMNAGSLDFGYVGAPPPIFVQAANNEALMYVGAEPIGASTEGIVVKRATPVTTMRDLKGKRIAVQKGSTAHYLVIEALHSAGLTISDVEPVYLAPALARAAFEADQVEAWSIWDPYLASVEAKLDLRVVFDNGALPEAFGFYMAPRTTVERSPGVLLQVLQELKTTGSWVHEHADHAAALIAPQVGLPLDVVRVWLRRARYGERDVNTAVEIRQQQIADAFFAQRLIPKRVDIASAVWKPAHTP